jgi:serine/threonine protein kinase
MAILTTEERLGTTIAGRYRLDRVLGEGGMGVVYAGEHLKLELPVAVKFLHPQYSRDPNAVKRFLREARATSRLTHPNVVQVRDVDIAEDDKSVYMVLELLQGESLATRLERERALSVAETCTILGPVCDALAAAHAMGIVHRDIKPDNVFLSRELDGRVTPKVLDFGIAKLTAESGGATATASGSIVGTAFYMAPEQAMGRIAQIGPASDVWSTAVMAYECLTGTMPFDAAFDPSMPPMAVLMATVTARIVPLKERRPELAALSSVLSAALDRDPASRMASIRELGDGIRAAAAALPPDVRSATPGPVPVPARSGGWDSAGLSTGALGTSAGYPANDSSRTSFEPMPASLTPMPASTASGEYRPPRSFPLPLAVGAGALLLVAAAVGVVAGTMLSSDPPPPPVASPHPRDPEISAVAPPPPARPEPSAPEPAAPPNPAPPEANAVPTQDTEPVQPAAPRAPRPRLAPVIGTPSVAPAPRPLAPAAPVAQPRVEPGSGHRAGGMSSGEF